MSTGIHRNRDPPGTDHRPTEVKNYFSIDAHGGAHSSAGKIEALRNAVLNSVSPDAPDADRQVIMLDLVDRFTPSHFRLVTLWDDPPAWFALHGLTPPQAGMAGSRTQTVEAGLPEMRGRTDFYLRVAHELSEAQMMTAKLSAMVSPSSLMDRLTTDFGRQFVRFIGPPE